MITSGFTKKLIQYTALQLPLALKSNLLHNWRKYISITSYLEHNFFLPMMEANVLWIKQRIEPKSHDLGSKAHYKQFASPPKLTNLKEMETIAPEGTDRPTNL